MEDWKWLGHKQHFIGASRCEFGLATLLPNGLLVSTIGDYRNPASGGIDEIGAERNLETIVFETTGEFHSCGCPIVKNWEGVGFSAYADAKEAADGHMEMCRKWEKKEADKGEPYWQDRPIEDALRARLAAAEELIAVMDAYNTISWSHSTQAIERKEALSRMNAARREWEKMK